MENLRIRIEQAIDEAVEYVASNWKAIGTGFAVGLLVAWLIR